VRGELDYDLSDMTYSESSNTFDVLQCAAKFCWAISFA
jgi:hypothetical protein